MLTRLQRADQKCGGQIIEGHLVLFHSECRIMTVNKGAEGGRFSLIGPAAGETIKFLPRTLFPPSLAEMEKYGHAC